LRWNLPILPARFAFPARFAISRLFRKSERANFRIVGQKPKKKFGDFAEFSEKSA
jgi:hypothetical protein